MNITPIINITKKATAIPKIIELRSEDVSVVERAIVEIIKLPIEPNSKNLR